MQFSKFFATAALLAIASAAQFTNSNFTDIEAGKPFTITWSGATHPVDLKLKNGPANVQVLVSTIASGLTANQFTWVPETTLVDGIYNLEIDDGTVINYSVQFPITGGTGVASTAASSSAAPTSASASSSAAAASTSKSSTAETSTTSSSPSSTSSKSSSTTSASSSTTSAPSVPSSNSAIQNGSPFALVILGALALAVMN